MSTTSTHALSPERRIRLFSPAIRAGWIAVFIITILMEILPVPLVHPVLFYLRLGFKACLFVALGYLTPLTFWRFDSLGLGVLFSVLAAMAGELLQSVSPGHSASLREFSGKLLLLLLGFAIALHSRYDRQIQIGFWKIALEDSHRKQKD